MRAELARYRRASGDVGSDVASERVASCRPSAHVDYSTHSLADEHPHVTHRCVQCLLTRRTQLTLQLLHECHADTETIDTQQCGNLHTVPSLSAYYHLSQMSCSTNL